MQHSKQFGPNMRSQLRCIFFSENFSSLCQIQWVFLFFYPSEQPTNIVSVRYGPARASGACGAPSTHWGRRWGRKRILHCAPVPGCVGKGWVITLHTSLPYSDGGWQQAHTLYLMGICWAFEMSQALCCESKLNKPQTCC